MRRNTIYERDKERLLTLGYEIRDTLKEYVKHTYHNRNAIRKNAVFEFAPSKQKYLGSTGMEQSFRPFEIKYRDCPICENML